MEGTRLNVFQRLLRQWDWLHPYNAAQLLLLRGSADLPRIEQAWTESLRAFGIGPVRVRGSRYHFVPLNGTGGQRLVTCSQDPVEDFITEQLNCPFNPDDGLPVRPFVVGDDGSYYLGTIYHHWIADSVSVRRLLQDVFLRLHDPGAAEQHPVAHAGTGYWNRFGPHRARWDTLGSVLQGVNWSARMKRVRRIESSNFLDFRMRFTLHDTEPGMIDQLRASARSQHATVNDLMLAAIAQSVESLGLMQHTPKRRDLSLGTIVDLRSHLTGPAAGNDDFGLFLGFSNIVLKPRELADWNRLVARIASQSRLHKQSGDAHASMVRMLAGLVFAALLRYDPSKIKHFYRKRLPLAGGISNVNLNGSWVSRYHPDPIMDYIRVSPTGPMMPLVFTPTTLGSRMRFGLTVRESVVDREASVRLASTFSDRLRSACQG